MYTRAETLPETIIFLRTRGSGSRPYSADDNCQLVISVFSCACRLALCRQSTSAKIQKCWQVDKHYAAQITASFQNKKPSCWSDSLSYCFRLESWKLYRRFPGMAFSMHLFRYFCCITMHSVRRHYEFMTTIANYTTFSLV